MGPWRGAAASRNLGAPRSAAGPRCRAPDTRRSRRRKRRPAAGGLRSRTPSAGRSAPPGVHACVLALFCFSSVPCFLLGFWKESKRAVCPTPRSGSWGVVACSLAVQSSRCNGGLVRSKASVSWHGLQINPLWQPTVNCEVRALLCDLGLLLIGHATEFCPNLPRAGHCFTL